MEQRWAPKRSETMGQRMSSGMVKVLSSCCSLGTRELRESECMRWRRSDCSLSWGARRI